MALVGLASNKSSRWEGGLRQNGIGHFGSSRSPPILIPPAQPGGDRACLGSHTQIRTTDHRAFSQYSNSIPSLMPSASVKRAVVSWVAVTGQIVRICIGPQCRKRCPCHPRTPVVKLPGCARVGWLQGPCSLSLVLPNLGGTICPDDPQHQANVHRTR